MELKTGLLVLAVGGLSLVAAPAMAADRPLTTDQQKFSYALGIQFGESIQSKGLSDIDAEAFSQGVGDALKDRKPKLSQEQMASAFEAMKTRLAAERAARADKAKAAGEKFLAQNKSKPGVVTLESGIQYKVIKEGDGPKPKAEDSVVAHYRGTRIDGTEFDSSYSRGAPATFPLQAVIEGWRQVLPLMPVGSKWQVVIPSALAYGENGAGSDIGPNETLIFDIELLSIEARQPE